MERRTGAKRGNFMSDLIIFLTFGDWNITTALFMSFVTDFIGLFMNFIEPLFAVCMGYVDALTVFNVVIFYESVVLAFIFFSLLSYLRLGLYQIQILLLWFHAVTALVLFPFLYTSVESCYPDIAMPRPLNYVHQYTVLSQKSDNGPNECTKDINNFYSRYFIRLVTVMIISLGIGIWHSCFCGLRAWKRLSTLPFSSIDPAAIPMLPIGDLDDEPISASPSGSGYRGDESSLPSSPPVEGAESAIPRAEKQKKYYRYPEAKPVFSSSGEE